MLFARETEALEQDLASGAFLPLHTLLGAPQSPWLGEQPPAGAIPMAGPCCGAGGSRTGIAPRPSPSSCAGTSLGMGTFCPRQPMAGTRASFPARGTPVQRDQSSLGGDKGAPGGDIGLPGGDRGSMASGCPREGFPRDAPCRIRPSIGRIALPWDREQHPGHGAARDKAVAVTASWTR